MYPLTLRKGGRNLKLDGSSIDEREQATGFAVIPYIQGVTEPIKRTLNNVKVAQKPFQTLGHIFTKPKDPVTKEQRTDAIYSIPCNDCDNEYIGQTKRQFGTRLKEHQRAVSFCKKENSALSEHTYLTNHAISWDKPIINKFGALKTSFFKFFFQTKLLRKCLGHVDACRVLRKKIGIGGLNSSLKGDKNIFLCSLSIFLPND